MKSPAVSVVMLACAPAFCNLLLASPAGALPLLQPVRDITSPLVDIVSTKKETAQPPQATAEPVRQVTTPLRALDMSPSSASGGVTPSAGSSVTSSPRAPVDPRSSVSSEASPNQTFAPLVPIDSTLARPGQSSRMATLAVATSAASTSQPTFAGWLQATPQGWQLFGVLWYWWVLVIGALYIGSDYVKKTPWQSIRKYGKIGPK